MALKIGPATRLYVSVAKKPGSFGATIYNRLFEEHGLDAVYLPRQAKDAAGLVAAIRALDIAGCSVSMPLKAEVIPQLDELDVFSSRTGSVNTIVNRNGRLCGWNTDYFGAFECVRNRVTDSAVVYGSGAVTGSVICALQDAGYRRIVIQARNSEKAERVAKRFGIATAIHPREKDFLLVNSTPASAELSGDSRLKELLEGAVAAFDLVVAQSETPWLEEARRRGLPVIPGYMMSSHQLARQFEIYTGIRPDIGRILELVRQFFLNSNA